MDKSGTAFPINETHHKQLGEFGLTKRELFAAMAMQGMAMRVRGILDHEVARAAVSLADATLAALSQSKDQK